ncbi:MAG: hypothetical protein AAF721_15120 [Myxococcota bacterium]
MPPWTRVLPSFLFSAATALGLGACGDDAGTSEAGSTAGATAGTTAVTTAMTTAAETSTGAVGATDAGSSDGATTGAPTTGESGPAADSTSSGGDEGNTSSGEGSGGSTGTTGGGAVAFAVCDTNGVGNDCPAGQTCHSSTCCFGSGFCVPDDVATCGGIVGTPCAGGTVCMTDLCLADGLGVCTPQDFTDDACAEQQLCWLGCPPA